MKRFLYFCLLTTVLTLGHLLFSTTPHILAQTTSCSLPGDLNCSGRVDQTDLRLLLTSYATSQPLADLDQTGLVNLIDFSLALRNFGTNLPSVSPTSPPLGSDPSFTCLTQSGPLQTITGLYNQDKLEPSVAANKKFDARTATFEYPQTISHAMVSLGNGDDSSPHMCWAGGYFTASRSWHDLDISWEISKQGPDDTSSDRGEMNNTTSATSYHDRMIWTGLHVYNMHDAIRTTNTPHWTIQHSWFDYARDDCIENDSNYSGTVYDSLFDGCYTGISNQSGNGAGQLITLDKLLLRMEPMPYPYKWDTKDRPLLYVDGYGNTPFGHGSVFKGTESDFPQFSITNSVFLHEFDAEETIFPPKNKVSACTNNKIIWLGNPSDAPTYLLTDFPGCFTIITDRTQGQTLWKNLVTDWHARHPGVGSNRKPAQPGVYTWPRY